MSKKPSVSIFSLFVFLFINVQAAVDTSWLVGQQNADGSFSAQKDIAAQVQNTAEALQTLYATGDIDLIDESLALQIIDASDSTHLENIVRKIIANNNADQDVSALIAQLKTFINGDGGFGSIVEYQSTVLDTALATQALAASGDLLDDDYSFAVGFLINQQNADGSWSSDGNASSVFITAKVSQALQEAQVVYDVASNVNSANDFLLTTLQNNIASTEVFEAALALLSIAPSTTDKTIYQFLIDYLTTTRDIDGSWVQDSYTTALAIRALRRAEIIVPVDESLSVVLAPSSTISAVTGVVTDNLSGQALAGAAINISMADGSQANALTSSDGRYTISQLSPGNATVTVSLASYHSVIATPVLAAGVIQYFNPTLIPRPQPVPVNITGTVVDADTNAPLASVSIQIVNSSIATQTGAAGDFQLNNILPGSITLQISNAGFISSSYAISAPSGGEVNLGLIALKPGSVSSSFGTVSGYITDSITGLALNGVAVTLSGADNKTAFTGADGRFLISNVNPGNINITAVLSSYRNAISTTDIVAGTNTQFNATMVKENDQAQVTLQGRVIDAQTQLPLSGVSIQIVNQTLSALSSASGQFQLGNIASGSFNVTLVLNGYNTLTYSVTASGGALLNMGQIALSASAPISANQPPVITSTAPANAQVGQTYTYAIQASDADNDVITYGFLSRPDGMTIDSASGLIKWEPTVAQAGAQGFTVLAFDNKGGKTQQVALINVVAGISDIYVVTDVQTLQSLYVEDTVPRNYVLGNYITGGRPNFMMSVPDCPLSFIEGPATVPTPQFMGALERLTASRALGVEIGAGVGTLWGGDLIMDLTTAQNTVAVFPMIDHGPFPEEGIEYTVWGSNDPNAVFPDGWTLATLVSIYTQGYVESPTCVDQDETDDYAGLYTFNNAYQYIRVRAANSISIFKTPAHTNWSTFLDNGSEPGWQSIEGEIDAVGGMSCSVKPAANAGADILGRTGQPIQFDASATPGNIVTYAWDLDNDNEIDISGVNPTHTFNAGFDQDITLYAVDDQGCVGVDTVRVTIDLNFPRPDLIIDALSVDAVSTNLQTLQVSGAAQVSVKNAGLAPANTPALVSVFEDTNANGVFDISVDNILGAITMSAGLARNDALSVAIPLNGAVNFRDSPIYAMVDSDAQIIESDETNNVETTLKQCLINTVPVGTFQPVLKWQWNIENVLSIPLVAPLQDTNNDGVIDEKDAPAVIFASHTGFVDGSFARLRAVDGKTGQEIWSVLDSNLLTEGSAHPAIGDIDNDGRPDIVMYLHNGGLAAINNDGTPKWSTAANVPGRVSSLPNYSAITLVDLDGDGFSEILVRNHIFNYDGTLRLSLPINAGHVLHTIAADLDMDGTPEILYGAKAFNADGTDYWDNTTKQIGFTGVGNFDNDAFPEIAVTLSGTVYLYDHTGILLWSKSAPSTGSGAPTIADMDGDGFPEIGVAKTKAYVVYNRNGSVLWATPVSDASGLTGSTVFDFDGDGRAEVVYADENILRVFDGRNGRVIYSIVNNSATASEYPVVADIDQDGHAEILVGGDNGSGLRVFKDAGDSWMPTRQIWNQYAYHIDNINNDTSIPLIEQPSWLSHNTYRLNAFVNNNPLALADISASLLKLIDNGTSQSISVRVGNGGANNINQAVNINFYQGNPTTGGTLLGTVTINNLASGAYQDVVLNNIPVLSGNQDIVVVADAGNIIQECNELNNTVNLPVFAGSASANLSVGTSAAQYIAGTQIPLQGIVTNSSAIPGQFLAQLQIEDAQGNVIQTFAQQNTNVLAGQASLSITDTWDSRGFLAGVYQLSGQLFDVQGKALSNASASFSLTSIAGQTLASLRTNTDKPIYHTRDQVRIDNLIRNLSTDAIINNAQLRITISNTSNVTVFSQTIAQSTLAAGNQRPAAVDYSFDNEPEGSYRVSAQLLTQQNNILATGQTSYIVASDATQTVIGKTQVQSSRLNQGQAQVCTDDITNAGDLDLTSLVVQQNLLAVNNQQRLQSQSQTINLAVGNNQTLVRNISTSSLIVGDYICALQANINGALRTLDFAAFTITAPPVQVEGDLKIGARGSLLIWLSDGHHNDKTDDDDPHDNAYTELNLEAQRQYLETLLNEAGWEYTLVAHRKDFINAFSSGEYQAYLLLNADQKMGNDLQKALREAVYRGDGLILSVREHLEHHETTGEHHRMLTNYSHFNLFDEVFGLSVKGHHGEPKQFNFVENNPLDLSGSITFDQAQQALSLELNQAQAVLRYAMSDCTQAEHHSPGQTANNENPIHHEDHEGEEHEGNECDASHQSTGEKDHQTVVSLNQYGQGRALLAGFDVLAYATRNQDKTLLTELIKQALIKTHPLSIEPLPSGLIPIEVNATNLGSAAQIKISLIAPTNTPWIKAKAGNINNPQVIWQYPSPAGSKRKVTAWAKLPATEGDVNVQLQIEAGLTSSNLLVQTQKNINLSVVAPIQLEDILSQITDLQSQGYDQTSLIEAQHWLEEALEKEQNNDLAYATQFALKATNELLSATETVIKNIRLQIDQWLRLAILEDEDH